MIEINRIKENIEKVKAEFQDIKDSLPFKINDKVQIISGVLKDEEGPVLQVYAERKVAVVELVQFGRKTPTEINFDDLKVI
jgi:transcription antitermination factor NusG